MLATSTNLTSLISNDKKTMSVINDRHTNFHEVEVTGSGHPPVPHSKRPQRVFQRIDPDNFSLTPSNEPYQQNRGKVNIVEDSDDGADTYLIPADPPNYSIITDPSNYNTSFQCSNIELPANSAASDFHSSSWKTRRRPQRFDSGVEDYESERGSGNLRFSTSPSVSSSGSMSIPRLSTHYEQQYEDIDQYSKKQLDVLPVQRQRNTEHTFPMVHRSGITLTEIDDADSITKRSIAETVSYCPDPLSPNGTLPNTYMPLNTSKNTTNGRAPAKTRWCCCVYVIATVMTCFISLVALALSIYVLTSTMSSDKEQYLSKSSQITGSLHQVLTSMKEEIKSLKQENQQLRAALVMQDSNLTSHYEPLKQEILQLSSRQDNFSTRIQAFEVKVLTEIGNISLTPGPQGQAGDFSLCVNRSISTRLPKHPTQFTDTLSLPSMEDLQKYFVTFAYCTYKGATDSNLESSPDNSFSRYQYHCKCWGQVPAEPYTVCTLHIWMCPLSI